MRCEIPKLLCEAFPSHLSRAGILGSVWQIRAGAALLLHLAQRDHGGDGTGGLPQQPPLQGVEADPGPQLLDTCGRTTSQ